MGDSEMSRGGRIASGLFVLALFTVVIFLALRTIPKADRPTLHQPSPATHSTAHH